MLYSSHFPNIDTLAHHGSPGIWYQCMQLINDTMLCVKKRGLLPSLSLTQSEQFCFKSLLVAATGSLQSESESAIS